MKLYRPLWTCGKFNEMANVAIYYNLIDGVAYTFEEFSALVIDYILKVPKGEYFDIEQLSDELLIGLESLTPFVNELCDIGLLSKYPMSYKLIEEQRNLKQSKIGKSLSFERNKDNNFGDDFPVEMNDAELFYHKRSGDITNIMLELTYNCSEQCIHCYNIGASRDNISFNNRNKIKSLSITEYKNIIEQFCEKGLVKVCVTGGDPFSYPCIWELLEFLYERDLAIDIYTNGISVVGHEYKIANLFPRLMGVSLYSGDANVHDSITRIKGSWHKTTTFIKNLSALSVPMVIKCCIMKPNVQSYRNVLEIGKKFNIPIQFDINVTDSVEGDKYVSENLRLPKEFLEVLLCDPLISLSLGNTNHNTVTTKDLNIAPCMAGHNTFCVTPDGNLIPCCSFHFVLGNLKSETLDFILKNSDRLKYWKGLKISDLEECGKYAYCAFCCLCCGLNYSQHKTILKASENGCYLAKIRYELANKLKDGYDPLKGECIEDRLLTLANTNNEHYTDI